MSDLKLTRTAYIKAPAEQVWRALTDPVLTVQYAGGRVQSEFRPGDAVVWLAPDGDQKLLEGVIDEVEPQRRLVLHIRWLFSPELAADTPHREVFEIEPLGEVTALTATFDEYAEGSPTFAACDMARTGDSMKSLLETGAALFGAAPAGD